MVKDSLKTLLDSFPGFLNKSENSNFYKSQYVSNRRFQELYQALFEVSNSIRLGKRCLIWKEQNAPVDYQINFVANFPHLKSVTCWKNDELIYSEYYAYEDNVDSFVYIYDSLMESTSLEENSLEETEETIINETSLTQEVIPQDKFKIIVETYDEYLIKKGFPENDEILGDEYDHDISLDEIGSQHNIPRKTYISTEDYAHTEPPYNDRLTEDDYHYMTRIINYVLMAHDTPLPVLEIWKMYGIFSDMINRDQYLLKMFDETMHPFDEETGLVGDWTPLPWEHKDRLCNLTPDYGRFFFVSANTLVPVMNQNIRFDFKFLNSLAETLSGDFNVSIFLNDEEYLTQYTSSSIIIPSDVILDDEPNRFVFVAFEGDTEFASEEVVVTVRGCNNADWYVSPGGDDGNDGKSSQTAFKSIGKALSSVQGEENLIVLTSGEHTINQVLPVPVSCTILGCGGPVVNSTYGLKFFNVLQGKELTLQNLTLKYDTSQALVENVIFENNNLNRNGLFVRISEGNKIATSILLSSDKDSYFVGESIVLTGSLVDVEQSGLSGKPIKIYVNNTLVDTVTTLNTGTFSKTITASTSGAVTIRAVFDGDEEYYSNSRDISVNVTEPEPASISITAEMPIMMKGQNNKITATVLDNMGNPCEGETVSFEVVDGESLGSAVTDSTGEASVYYLGKDAYYINIKAILDSLEDTVQIHDVFYYNPQTYTTQTTLSIPNFPSNFQCEFKTKISGTNWIIIGKDSNNNFFFGQTSSEGSLGIYVKKNGSYKTYKQGTRALPKNSEVEITYTYLNGVQTVTCNGISETLTDSSISERNYIQVVTAAWIKGIIIHEL